MVSYRESQVPIGDHRFAIGNLRNGQGSAKESLRNGVEMARHRRRPKTRAKAKPKVSPTQHPNSTGQGGPIAPRRLANVLQRKPKAQAKASGTGKG